MQIVLNFHRFSFHRASQLEAPIGSAVFAQPFPRRLRSGSREESPFEFGANSHRRFPHLAAPSLLEQSFAADPRRQEGVVDFIVIVVGNDPRCCRDGRRRWWRGSRPERRRSRSGRRSGRGSRSVVVVVERVEYGASIAFGKRLVRSGLADACQRYCRCDVTVASTDIHRRLLLPVPKYGGKRASRQREYTKSHTVSDLNEVIRRVGHSSVFRSWLRINDFRFSIFN